MKLSNASTGKSSRPSGVDKRKSCRNCRHYWNCMERSRDYPCTEFRLKQEKTDGEETEQSIQL